MARGKCCYFFIPTGREKRTEFAKKEGRFFKFVETGEVDAPVFTRVENPGIMGEKHGRGWARMDQTQRALLSTLYERWYGVLHRYAQWAVGDALLAKLDSGALTQGFIVYFFLSYTLGFAPETLPSLLDKCREVR